MTFTRRPEDDADPPIEARAEGIRPDSARTDPGVKFIAGISRGHALVGDLANRIETGRGTMAIPITQTEARVQFRGGAGQGTT